MLSAMLLSAMVQPNPPAVSAPPPVAAYYQAMLKGNLDAAAAEISGDAVLLEPNSLPYGGVHRGKPAFEQVIRAFPSYWIVTKADALSYVTQGAWTVASSEPHRSEPRGADHGGTATIVDVLMRLEVKRGAGRDQVTRDAHPPLRRLLQPTTRGQSAN